jgi:hypothetical protein
MNTEQQRRALIGAGIQNIAGGIDTFTGGMLQQNYIDAMTGGGGQGLGRRIAPIGLGSSTPSSVSGMSAIMG